MNTKVSGFWEGGSQSYQEALEKEKALKAISQEEISQQEKEQKRQEIKQNHQEKLKTAKSNLY